MFCSLFLPHLAPLPTPRVSFSVVSTQVCKLNSMLNKPPCGCGHIKHAHTHNRHKFKPRQQQSEKDTACVFRDLNWCSRDIFSVLSSLEQSSPMHWYKTVKMLGHEMQVSVASLPHPASWVCVHNLLCASRFLVETKSQNGLGHHQMVDLTGCHRPSRCIPA